MTRVVNATIGLFLLIVFLSPAEAMNVTLAEVQNGLAVVQGNKAAKSATITWEGDNVTQATKGGSFGFSGIVPLDCVGTLSDGVDTIEVPLFNCTPAPPPAAAPAPVPQTGQTTCRDSVGNVIACAGTGQDGDLQAGVALPQPRFTDNGDGTITDNLTGLIWLKDADCFGLRTWAQALADANNLAHGQCGLTDGSVAGDWYLPNVRQLYSLIHYEFFNPTVSNAAGTGQAGAGDPFTNLRNQYWSSTTSAYRPSFAWNVSLGTGHVLDIDKTWPAIVLPVRGP